MKSCSLATAFLSVSILFSGSLHSQSEVKDKPEGPPMVDEQPALPLPPGISLESQCGSVDDLQDVEFYDGTLGVTKEYVTTNEPSTIQFQWLPVREILDRLPNHDPGNIDSKRWCSGTLISKALVLTAGHCFDIQRDTWITPFKLNEDRRPVYAEPDVLATLQQANFKYQLNGATGSVRDSVVFPVIRLVEFRLGNLDYAIVELGSNKQNALPGDLFEAGTAVIRAPIKNDLIAILQHPQGKPKKIEAGQVQFVSSKSLWYDDVDTHGGSSGSGVRDATGQVIGVHTNGGCRVNSGANRGVNTSAVAEVSDIL